MLIGIGAAAVVILLILIVLLVTMLGHEEEDDGKILPNVFAAGVNLGGMTSEQAKAELQAQTADTYGVLDMTISILDSTFTLSPSDTGASLDIDAVVKAAYNYGRTGSKSEQQRAREQAQNSSYTISILPYLNLNTDYIQSAINALGQQFSTSLKQTTYTLDGTRPALEQETYDTSVTHQTLVIHLGTAEYGLKTAELYEQILDAYEINLFSVTAQCSIITPDPLDLEALYINAGCIAPVNADFDVDTYEVTPHVYGYGFTMDQLKTAVESAKYGDEILLELRFIQPDITSDFYTKDMFQDVLGTFSTPLTTDMAWNTNLRLAASLLNGTIIKRDEVFSFNDIVGEPTEKRGFAYANKYLGKSYQSVLGGGLCQAASTIYYCALMADLEILERSNHSYAVDYIQAGFDAEILYGLIDLKFTNNTENAIRIDAQIKNDELRITILGSDTRTYQSELSYVVDQTYVPETVYNTMYEFNIGGYTEGTILSEGIVGYKISTYITRLDKESGSVLEEVLVTTTYYAKRDKVVVDIYEPPIIDPDPTDPSDPVDPSDPTDPSDPSVPDETDPSQPSEATEPQDPTESTDTTE